VLRIFCFLSTAFRLRSPDSGLQTPIAHRLFFRAISINDDFLCDATLTFSVLRFRHTVAGFLDAGPMLPIRRPGTASPAWAGSIPHASTNSVPHEQTKLRLPAHCRQNRFLQDGHLLPMETARVIAPTVSLTPNAGEPQSEHRLSGGEFLRVALVELGSEPLESRRVQRSMSSDIRLAFRDIQMAHGMNTSTQTISCTQFPDAKASSAPRRHNRPITAGSIRIVIMRASPSVELCHIRFPDKTPLVRNCQPYSGQSTLSDIVNMLLSIPYRISQNLWIYRLSEARSHIRDRLFFIIPSKAGPVWQSVP